MFDTSTLQLKVLMSYELNRYQIRYTFDGTEPDVNAILYEESFVLTKTASIKAATFKNNKLYLLQKRAGKLLGYSEEESKENQIPGRPRFVRLF